MKKPPMTVRALVPALILALTTAALAWPTVANAESQTDYPGISDPFGDPSAYEFAEDEREDKEFFHLGRFLMLGVDIGLGVFTGGLGSSVEPGPNFGGRILYFIDRQLALEAAVRFGSHIDQIRTSTGSADVNVSLVNIGLGFRYYFDTKNAPKAIAIANPYLVFAGGIYIRSEEVSDVSSGFTVPDGSGSSFGAAAGGGVEFAVYRRHIYLGLDMRYHLVLFPDENDATLGDGARAGDYVTALATLSYNF